MRNRPGNLIKGLAREDETPEGARTASKTLVGERGFEPLTGSSTRRSCSVSDRVRAAGPEPYSNSYGNVLKLVVL